MERFLPQLVEAVLAPRGIDLKSGLCRGPVIVDVGVQDAGIELVEGSGLCRATAFSIQVYTETKPQSRIFLKKMPPATISKR